ncbi:MAG: zinc-ribbon domain-containing protein [Thermoplasmata archaeon]|nr:MAG: zinc-ribbon domain-containing protein [Thermoplasmata archaeon]
MEREIILCPDCGLEISKKDTSCPNCGLDLKYAKKK